MDSSFPKLLFDEIYIWTVKEIWVLLVGTFKGSISCRNIIKMTSLASRKSSLECPGILIVSKVADKSITSNEHRGHFNLISTRCKEVTLLPQNSKTRSCYKSILNISIPICSFVLDYIPMK